MKKIVIVGDGIIGLLSALASAKYNHQVTVIDVEKSLSKQAHVERYFSINLLSKHVLMHYGIWELINLSLIHI